MPSVPTYIRQADMKLYEAIRSQRNGAWTEWIHSKLHEDATRFNIENQDVMIDDHHTTADRLKPHHNYLKKKNDNS